jgi:UPF0755 protein
MNEQSDALKITKKNHKKIWIALAIIVLACVIAVVGCLMWYKENLKPVNPQGNVSFFEVRSGDTTDMIASRLKQAKLIKSTLAFQVALRLDGTSHALKAGSYRLSPVESTAEIIDKLVSGKVDLATLQIAPGQTLEKVRDQMIQAGYEAADVDAALAKTYDHPLLADKPASATLEGYIFPDTYQIDLQQKPDVLLTTIFDTFYKKLQDQDLLSHFSKEKLTIYQAVTLASIIQKEASKAADQPHIAQVFLKRLVDNMPLGSDVTAIYGALIAGQPTEPNSAVQYDSPYNTRIHSGLPPGPIANFNFSAIAAVASPTDTQDLYFVAGDNGIIYYATNLIDHENNVTQYCQQQCQ